MARSCSFRPMREPPTAATPRAAICTTTCPRAAVHRHSARIPATLFDNNERDRTLFTQDGALYSQPDASKALTLLHDLAALGNLVVERFPLYDAESGEEHGYQLSPDGRSAIYRTHDGDMIATNLYRVPLAGGAPVRLNLPLGPGGAIEGRPHQRGWPASDLQGRLCASIYIQSL